MINLLKSEIYKIKVRKLALVSIIIVLSLITLLISVESVVVKQMSDFQQNPNSNIEMSSDDVMGFYESKSASEFIQSLLNGDLFGVPLAIVICLFITHDFRNKIIGLPVAIENRKSVYLSKLISGWLIGAITVVALMVYSTIIAYVVIGDRTNILVHLPFILQSSLMQTLILSSLISIFTMLGFLIPSTGLCMVATLLVDSIVTLFFQLLMLMKINVEKIFQFLPSQMQRTFSASENYTVSKLVPAIIACIIIIAITSAVGMLKFDKTDL